MKSTGKKHAVLRTPSGLEFCHVEIAKTPWERMRGLLGRPVPGPGRGLLIERCPSVHTFGMRYPIDVVFLSGTGRVVRVVRNLKPWRVARGGKGAQAVVELAAGVVGRVPPDSLFVE